MAWEHHSGPACVLKHPGDWRGPSASPTPQRDSCREHRSRLSWRLGFYLLRTMAGLSADTAIEVRAFCLLKRAERSLVFASPLWPQNPVAFPVKAALWPPMPSPGEPEQLQSPSRVLRRRWPQSLCQPSKWGPWVPIPAKKPFPQVSCALSSRHCLEVSAPHLQEGSRALPSLPRSLPSSPSTLETVVQER